MDLGVLQAGFQVLASIERDPHCCDTLREAVIREKRKTLVIEQDIREVAPQSLLDDLHLVPGELSLLFGGPPCQAFSQIGKRACLDDERGMLLFEILRFAEILQPKAILLEQVKGLLNAPDQSGEAGGVFRLFIRRLEALDYVPKWRLINAAEYGVAQLRQRVFLVATKKPNGFEFPLPTHGRPSDGSLLFPIQPYTTVGRMLKGLRKPTPKGGPLLGDSHVDVTPDGDRHRIHGVPEGSHLAREIQLPSEQRCNLSKKDTTKFRRLSRLEPSNTLRCGEIFFHPIEDRYLTPREYMRIHGYPDDYELRGPIRGRSGQVKNLDQHRQVANSVPPPVARAIAEQIKRTIECQNSLKSSDSESQTSPRRRQSTGARLVVHS